MSQGYVDEGNLSLLMSCKQMGKELTLKLKWWRQWLQHLPLSNLTSLVLYHCRNI